MRAALALALSLTTVAASAAAEAPPPARPAPATKPAAEAKKPVAEDPELEPYPPPTPRVLAPAKVEYTYAAPQAYPSLSWFPLQLIPSPELVVGRDREVGADGKATFSRSSAFGLRWQLAPIVWSWGTNRRISRWRFFAVDPLARHSGSLELSGTLEYVFGYVDRFIARPGVRAFFPLVQRGEYLSASLGTSTYSYDDQLRVAYDLGLYTLYGLFGLQATVAPNHAAMGFIGTFRIQYF